MRGTRATSGGYFDAPLLAELGVKVDMLGKMPDVVIYFAARNWLLLVEFVTSHGPVDGNDMRSWRTCSLARRPDWCM